MAGPRKLSHADYTVAWICALPLELTAATAMLDEVHSPLPQSFPASCTYSLGKISGHNVVLACLPAGVYGTTAAAIVTSHLRRTFSNVRYGVLVGIGGGVPSARADIRLGDVVVSKPTGTSSGVIQYDFGKATSNGLQRIGTVNQPPLVLLAAVSHLEAGHLREKSHQLSNIVGRVLDHNPQMAARFSRPSTDDRLFEATYHHPENENTCKGCARTHERLRSGRSTKEPQIHYGTIASGNQVIKDGQTRDRIAREHDCLCFEMEAAGIMNELQCLVVRGICDYCDSHKNKDWQGYAALTAAAYTKVLLGVIPVDEPQHGQVAPRGNWMVPFQRNAKFLGRSQEIARMEQKILRSTGTRRAALSGLGGVGKTQIAVELAYRIREQDPERSIFWIPSTSIEAVEQAFLNIGDCIGLRDVAPVDLKMEVKKYFMSSKAGPWLLIVDNADDMAMWTTSAAPSPALREFLPQSDDGFILFTTRNQQLATKLVGSEVVQIQEMDSMTTTNLLRSLLIRQELIEEKESVTELLSRLHRLPLAITQAATYINENSISLVQYISLLNQQESGLVELLSQDFEDEWRYKELKNPVAVTWLVSFKQIQQLNSLAIDYLSFMACIDPRDIPESLLPQTHHCSPVLHTKALGILKSYSFITEQTSTQFISIHRLVHLATRNWLRNEEKLLDYMSRATQRMGEIFPSDDPKNRVLWREYLPHAQYILQNLVCFEGIKSGQGLSKLVGLCLLSDGRYKEASILLQEVFEDQVAALGADHPDTLASMNSLGRVLRQQGKYEDAETIHRQALDLRKKVLGLDHPDTLISMNNLGLVLDYQGKYDEAEAIHQQALEIKKRVLSEYHPSTLTSMNNLGLVLNSQGKYEEAEAIHQQELEISRNVLGIDHPDTLISMNNLGMVLDNQGKHEEAEAIHQQSLKIQKKVLGVDHPDVLISMNNLGSVFNNQGRYEEAEVMHQQALDMQNKVLGMDHPDTLISMNNLGMVLDKQGKYEEAEAIYQQALEVKKRVLGVDHPDTLSSMRNLCEFWKRQGQDMQALELLQTCVQSHYNVLGPSHPESLSAAALLNDWRLSPQITSASLQECSDIKTSSQVGKTLPSSTPSKHRKRDIVIKLLRRQ